MRTHSDDGFPLLPNADELKRLKETKKAAKKTKRLARRKLLMSLYAHLHGCKTTAGQLLAHETAYLISGRAYSDAAEAYREAKNEA